jgi:Mor family transcriptional regulator
MEPSDMTITATTAPVCAKPAPAQDADPVSLLVAIYRANGMAFGQAPTPEMETAFEDRVLHELGGVQMYVPRISSKRRKEIHEWIRAHWLGDNVDELAKKTRLSPRRVRQLVNADKPEEKQ